MSHIFRHKINERLYTIEHIIVDHKHLNGNGFSGIYARPYDWNGYSITHTLQEFREGDIEWFDPERFVKENFEIVGEL